MTIRKAKPKEGMVQNTSLGSRLVDAIIMLVLAAFMFCCFIPLWHVLMMSLSDGKALMAHSGLLFLPAGGFNLDGYKMAFEDISILTGYLNTLIYVAGATIFGMTVNIFGGYVLSCESRLKPLLTVFIIFTMMFHGGLIPSYMVVKNLGLLGTRWAILLPGCTNGFFTIMIMNAFKGVPVSTVEAARLDGAGHLTTMWRIMLPQCGSMVTVVVLNSVVLQWNSWFNASIYLANDRDKWPLQLWIKQLTADNADFMLSAHPDYNRYLVQYVVIIAATLPSLCAFPFFQKHLEKGVISGAVKG